MKIDWKNNLSPDMYDRLCDCRNKKSDIIPMAKVVIKTKNYSPSDALELVLEWIGDWNGQFEITDLTTDEYGLILLNLENYKKVLDNNN